MRGNGICEGMAPELRSDGDAFVANTEGRDFDQKYKQLFVQGSGKLKGDGEQVAKASCHLLLAPLRRVWECCPEEVCLRQALKKIEPR